MLNRLNRAIDAFKSFENILEAVDRETILGAVDRENIYRTSKSHKNFLGSCTVALRIDIFHIYLAEKRILCRRYFRQCNPSILKCLHGINLLNAFNFVHRRFPASFFFTRRLLLRNRPRIWYSTFLWPLCPAFP